MNKNKRNLLWTTLVFFGAFCAWINTITISVAESTVSSPVDSLQKEQIKETSTDGSILPTEVKSAVIEAASGQTSRTVAYLKILDSQPKEWTDGCLGLTEPGKVCIQNIVSGWQVEVTDGLRNWTYRTDNSGDLVKLEPSAE